MTNFIDNSDISLSFFESFEFEEYTYYSDVHFGYSYAERRNPSSFYFRRGNFLFIFFFAAAYKVSRNSNPVVFIKFQRFIAGIGIIRTMM